MSTSEPHNVASFKQWLVENGAKIHPAVHFQPGERVRSPETSRGIGDELRKIPPSDIWVQCHRK